MRDEYEIFARVVEGGSLSAAARKLGLSPAQVSKRLARLEDRLGVRLLDRTTRQQALTDRGRQFYERVQAILDAVGEAESLVSGRDPAARGLIRVSAPTSFGRMHLAPHLKGFLDGHPDLALELNLNDAYVDLEAEGIDVAVRIAAPDAATASAVWLAPNRRLLCATPEYLDAHGAPGDLADLRGHRLLAATPQATWRLVGPAGPVAHRVRSVVPTNSSEVVRELLLAGLGIGLRSTWDIGDELASGRLRPVLPGYRGAADVGIYAVTSPRRADSAAVRGFVGFLRDLYGPRPYWDAAG